VVQKHVRAEEMEFLVYLLVEIVEE